MSESAPIPERRREEILESWKEIAAYLGKGVRTVVRWEKTEGLPVHRHQHERRSAVFAYKSELDQWWGSRQSVLEHTQVLPPAARRVRWLWLSLILPIGGLAFWLARPQPVSLPNLPLNFEPLTTYPAFQSSPSFSPDGHHFAFAWTGWNDENVDIYIQAIGSAEPKRLTGHRWMEFSPAWSPDGKSIAFLRRSPQFKIELLLIPPLGGVERKLADLKEAHYMDAPQLSWSPDGKWLAFADRDADGPGIFTLAPETGERRRLTKGLMIARSDLDPAFSPDGKTLAFRRGESETESEIYLQELSGDGTPIGQPEKLTDRRVRSTSPVWSGDGRYLFFSSGIVDSGIDNIYRLQVRPRTSDLPVRLTAATGESYYALAVSSRGGFLASTFVKGHSEIWVTVKTSKSWSAPARIEFLSSTRNDSDPALSPDGRRIAFVSDRSGHLEIWVSKRDGSQTRKLTSFGSALVSSPRWSPDSKHLTFSATSRDKYAVWTIDAAGGPPRKLAEPAWSSSWSQDGRWIYYSSPTHQSPQIFKVPATGGAPLKVVDTADLQARAPLGGNAVPRGGVTRRGWEFGNRPVESTDGKLLFFQGPGGLWRRRAEGGEPEFVSPIYPSAAVCTDGAFFRGNQESAASEPPLMFYHFSSGVTLEVAKIGPRPHKGISASPDCKTVLYTQIQNESRTLLFARGVW